MRCVCCYALFPSCHFGVLPDKRQRLSRRGFDVVVGLAAF